MCCIANNLFYFNTHKKESEWKKKNLNLYEKVFIFFFLARVILLKIFELSLEEIY